MSRKGRSRQARRRTGRTAPVEPPPRSARGRALGAAAAVALVLAAGALVLLRAGTNDGNAFPPPPNAAAAVRFEDFVGSEACRACHSAEYDAWSGSTHGRAGGPPDRVELLVAFDGAPIVFRDAVVRPTRTGDGRFVFEVEPERAPREVVEVTGVIGGGHMVGGGTQGFVTSSADGTLRFLPFDYSAAEQTWFCNTLSRRNEGWLPVTPDLALSDCADWPPVRILGSHSSVQNCQQCHGSQILLTERDDPSEAFETRYTSLGVNCESCHGPGRIHVGSMEREGGATGRDIGMRALAAQTKDGSLAVCFQCHALKNELAAGYLPGAPFPEYFSLRLAILIGAPFFPDGRVRTFAYQENHLSSACYYAGSMTCTDCHDPHAQTYRDHVGTPLASRFDDGQCLSCHPSKAEAPERHTRHPRASPGGRCVACHMPYLQHPLVGNRIRYARSDHTISIPRPGFDAGFRITGACLQCHEAMSTAALDSVIGSWYGTLRPLPVGTRALLTARGLRDIDRAAELVLAEERAESPLATFTRLSHFFLRYVGPDMPVLADGIVARLRAFAESTDDDVAALALASLHLARGADAEVRAFLEETLAGLGARHLAVRRRWVAILVTRGRAYQVTGELPAALATHRKTLELDPQNTDAREMIGQLAIGD